MKRLLAFALLPAALALLTGCGGTACTSNAAQVNTTSPQCTVGAGSSTSFSVSLCAKCTDSSPSCQAELVGGQVQLAPSVQQCQENAGCAIAGCNAPAPTATCTLNASLTPGSYVMLVGSGDTTVNGTLTVAPSGPSSCTL